jgi:predicted permease
LTAAHAGWITADVRIAVRRLRASPTFTTFAILTLALGIGSTTAIYSVIRAALGPPSGVTTIDRLVTVTHSAGGSLPMIALSYGDFQDLRARQTAFQDVAGWSFLRLSLSADGRTGTSWGEIVTGEYFQVLGVRAALGRTLQPADDDASATPVAVISHNTWQRMFGGSPDVVGRLIKANGVPFEIVGVAARDFAGLFNNGLVPSAMWMPMAAARILPRSQQRDRLDRSARWIQVRARLKGSVLFDAARTDVLRIAQQLDQTAPLGDSGTWASYQSRRQWVVRRTADISLNEGSDRIVRPMAATVMAAVGLVLLVACTNLANLMLARGSGRRQESAIRLALGASRGRLVRAELTESLLLAAAGGLGGLGVARVVLTLLGNDVPVGNGNFIHFVPRLDATVLTMSAAATVLAVLVAGLLPAWQSTRADVRAALASGGSSAALPRWRGRRMLIAAQVTVSVILVSLAGLCIGQLRELGRIDVGMDLDRLAIVEVDFGTQQYAQPRVREIADAVLANLTRRQDVDAVSISSGLPSGVGTPGCRVGVGSALTRSAELLASTPGIFEALGVSVVKGRALGEQDIAASAPVAVVSASIAQAVFDTTDVIGRSISVQRSRWSDEPEHAVVARTIVGVVADTRTGATSAGAVYVPFTQHYEGNLVVAVRTPGDPAGLVPAVRKSLAAVDPDVAVVQAGTGIAIAGPSNLFLQITAGLTGILGGFALALALAGLYGALTHVILRRRREIGLRMALGASRRDILRMVLRDGLRPVVSGIALGLALGVLARVWMTPFFERLIPALDPFVLTVVPLLLLACGAVACLIPARRASRVDPNLALRDL